MLITSYILTIHYFVVNRVSPPGTPFTMRGTIRPWSAHPHVKRSAGRYDQTEFCCARFVPPNLYGGIFLIGKKLRDLDPRLRPGVCAKFLLSEVTYGPSAFFEIGLEYVRFKIFELWMIQRAKNGHFWPFWPISLIFGSFWGCSDHLSLFNYYNFLLSYRWATL